MVHPEFRINHRAGPLRPYMRKKSILIAIVMVSSSLAGCTSDNSEVNLNARYQEGYDAGYADAYDSSYDGVAQHNYNEGWDDGWEIANTDSRAEIIVMQAEIMEIQALASSLNATIISLQNANQNLENNNPCNDQGNGTEIGDENEISIDPVNNYSGFWSLQTPISFTCAFGSVSLELSTFEITDFDSTQIVDNFSINFSNINGETRVMNGNYSNDNFFVQLNILGGCEETYTLSGQFTNSTFSGRFDAIYSGSECYDCSEASWNIIANLN